MKNTNRQIVLVLMTVIIAFLTVPSFAVASEKEASIEQDLAVGKRIFNTVCFLCHGKTGKGDGGAAMFLGPYSHPRPNNFTLGSIKFRSTESGELPTLQDLMRTIERGIPGFMPSFKNLPGDGVRQVALFVAKEFIGEELPTETTLKFIADPYANDDRQEVKEELNEVKMKDWNNSWFGAKKAQKISRMDGAAMIQTVTFISSATLFTSSAAKAAGIKRGEKLFYEMQCISCHGEGGRGAKTNMKDERDLPVMAANLSRPETFGNGNSPQDIYRTIMTGLNGTPMPSFSDLFEGEEEKVWDLVHYILSLKKSGEEASADFSNAYFEYNQVQMKENDRAANQVVALKAESDFTNTWIVSNTHLTGEMKSVEDTNTIASSSSEENWTQGWTASNPKSEVVASMNEGSWMNKLVSWLIA